MDVHWRWPTPARHSSVRDKSVDRLVYDSDSIKAVMWREEGSVIAVLTAEVKRDDLTQEVYMCATPTSISHRSRTMTGEENTSQ